MIDMGINPNHVYGVRAQELGVPFVDLTVFAPDQGAVASIPHEIARRNNALAVRKDGGTLWVALADISNGPALDEIRLAARCRVCPVMATPEALRRAIAICYGGPLPD
jgi:type IV pilus assembly protein PilB